jgi:hypothetical protein
MCTFLVLCTNYYYPMLTPGQCVQATHHYWTGQCCAGWTMSAVSAAAAWSDGAASSANVQTRGYPAGSVRNARAGALRTAALSTAGYSPRNHSGLYCSAPESHNVPRRRWESAGRGHRVGWRRRGWSGGAGSGAGAAVGRRGRGGASRRAGSGQAARASPVPPPAPAHRARAPGCTAPDSVPYFRHHRHDVRPCPDSTPHPPHRAAALAAAVAARRSSCGTASARGTGEYDPNSTPTTPTSSTRIRCRCGAAA